MLWRGFRIQPELPSDTSPDAVIKIFDRGIVLPTPLTCPISKRNRVVGTAEKRHLSRGALHRRPPRRATAFERKPSRSP